MRPRTLDASITAASGRDYDDVIALLEAASLPAEDLAPGSMAHFLVARNASGKVIGAIGFERYGRAGLLRSLVVATQDRDRKLGSQMVAELEARCRSLALAELFLLAMKRSLATLCRWLCVPPRNLRGCVRIPRSA